ncbi:MAG: ATP-binding protein [Hydrococcus sp. Prado102]|jgi:signal transduction histidine kinase|nr:ATP-binding protein [Hydrococcus sp. Prado102]
MRFRLFSRRNNSPRQLQGRRNLFADVRIRILVWYFVLATCITLGSIWATYKIFCAQEEQLAESRLNRDIIAFQSLVEQQNFSSNPSPQSLTKLLEQFIASQVRDPNEYLFLVLDGQLYRQNRTSLPPLLQNNPNQIEQWATSTQPNGSFIREGYLIRVARPLAVGGQNQGIVLGIYDATIRYRMAEKTLTITIAVSLAGIFLFSVIAWIAAGKILEPLRMLTKTARSITETDLTQRLSVRGSDEIAQMSLTFNQMLDRLQAAFLSQQDFIRDASHELRTPITIIRGHLDLMGDDPIERQETVALVKDELKRMSRFVNDLLLLMKAERPNFLRLETVDLRALTEEVFAKARGLGDRTWQLEAVGEGFILLDRQRITQVILNLAQNATQYTQARDVIAIGSAVEGDRVRFWVRDSGEGIAIQDQERIFDRFARGRNSERRSEGSGLGLSIVQALVKAHGGHVEMFSRLGEGSTFSVVIPRRTSLESDRPNLARYQFYEQGVALIRQSPYQEETG